MARSYHKKNLNKENRKEKINNSNLGNLLYTFAMDASTILLKPFVK